MNRLPSVTVTVAVLAGSLLAVNPVAATPVPAQAPTVPQAASMATRTVTEDEFLTLLDEKTTGLINAMDGSAVRVSTVERERNKMIQRHLLRMNPNGSYVNTVADKGGVRGALMCFPPKGIEGTSCYQRERNKPWVYQSMLSEDRQSVLYESFLNSVFLSDITYSTGPEYTVQVNGDTTVLTASSGWLKAVYRFTPRSGEARYTNSKARWVETSTFDKAKKVRVFTPKGDEVNPAGFLWDDMNEVAKALETEYVDTNVFPRDVVKVATREGNEFKVCYDSKSNPQAYVILGSLDGGATVYKYDSANDGLNPTPLESSGFPACSEVLFSLGVGTGKPMVDGPSVVQ